MASPDPTIETLVAALRGAHPELEAVVEAASEPLYVVGGAVRDLMLGHPRSDLDLVVEGDAAALAERLGGGTASHERFGTAKVRLGEHEVDLASARTETYPEPGALPEVRPAASVEEDLRRRDFTINAMAIPLRGEPRLIDPHDGRADLERGILRILHAGSFADDPTRALRAARYAARFGFEPEPDTEGLLRRTDLSTVSADRRRAELERLAGEPTARRGFELLAEWGLVRLRGGALDLIAGVEEQLQRDVWAELVPRPRAVLAAALGPPGRERELAEAPAPATPAEGVEIASRHGAVELILARVLGATWLDRYLTVWRQVRLEIDGDDLIAAGVAPGPAVGRGLRAALELRLNGEVFSREEELAAALEAARRG